MYRVLLGVVVLLLATALFFGGFMTGQSRLTGLQSGWMTGSGQRGLNVLDASNGFTGCDAAMAAGMGGRAMTAQACGDGLMGNGPGIMGNMMGGGMMGAYGRTGPIGVDPLSLEEAEATVNSYLASLGEKDLALGEIMIFDNHAYAQIIDTSSDLGAFEVLVDPVSRNVYSEPGPNMMWNTEYGHMFGENGVMGQSMMGGMMSQGIMGQGMMGNLTSQGEVSVTGEEAIEIAQRYLDAQVPGTTVGETADPFPGYYTIHTLREGEIEGMLSVNAYTGQVFQHHWHGDFVEMAGEHHD